MAAMPDGPEGEDDVDEGIDAEIDPETDAGHGHTHAPPGLNQPLRQRMHVGHGHVADHLKKGETATPRAGIAPGGITDIAIRKTGTTPISAR